MYFTFKMFRVALLTLVIVMSLTCLPISGYLSRNFAHLTTIFGLIVLPLTTVVGTLWCLCRKRILHTQHTVLCEIVSAFAISPCHIVLCLYVTSLRDSIDGPDLAALIALQVLAFGITFAVATYGMALLVISLLTVATFDEKVWLRDLDSTPSPFPMSIIFHGIASIFKSSSKQTAKGTASSAASLCTGGAHCECKRRKTDEEDTQAAAVGKELQDNSKKSVLDLVQVPDAVQIRQTICIGFEV